MKPLLILVLVASSAWGRVPLRPTFAEISLRLDPVTPYKYLRGTTADQLATDSMEETRAGRGVPDAIRAAMHVPACSSTLGTVYSIYNKLTAKLIPVYEDSKMQSGGEWFVGPEGRHYGDEKYILQALQGCMAGSGAGQCATWAATRSADELLPTANVLDLLDIQVKNGRCVEGGTFTLPTPTEPWQSQTGDTAVFASRQILPALSAQQVAALDGTQAALDDFGNALCTGNHPASNPVFDAHLAFEALARDDTQEHYVQLKPYRLTVDPRWSAAQRCRLATKGATAHQLWMQAVKAGDWGAARIADNDHWQYTICLGLDDPRLLIRPSCATVIDECPTITCQQAAGG